PTPPPPPPFVPPPIPFSEYASLEDPPDGPKYTFTYIPSLHILGMRHTLRRIKRFLSRRHYADEICEEVVACILEQAQREWRDEDAARGEFEERFWPKSIAQNSE